MDVLMFLIRKYVLFAAASWIVLRNLTFITITETLVVALAATLVSYLVSDIGVLPTWGNAAATSADFFVVWLTIWGSQLLHGVLNIAVTDAALTAALIAAGEWFLHQHLMEERAGVAPTGPEDAAAGGD